MNYHRKIIYILGFILSIPVALTAYLNSTFIASLINERYVGIVYSIGSIFSMLSLLFAPRVFSKIGGYKFLLLTSFISILGILGIVFLENSWVLIIMFLVFLSFNVLTFFSIDEFLKIFSEEKNTGVIRGRYMSLANLAWIVAQLAFGLFIGKLPVRSIYFIGFLIMVIGWVITLFGLRKTPEPKYDKLNISKSLFKFFKNTNLSKAYALSFLLQIFYSFMLIYTPIYLSLHLGFSWQKIGIIFTIMLIPFSIIPIQFGKYGDKVGERSMLMFGFLIIALSTGALFFIPKETTLVFWALVLFITRIGAALIEIMSDIYFFKHIKPENEEFVGVYRTAPPVAFVFGPLLGSVIFTLIPSFNYIYLVLGMIMLVGINVASRIKKNEI